MFEDLVSMQSGLWNDMQRLQREMDSLFRTGQGRTSIRAVAGGTFPAINVGATDDEVRVYVFAPGLAADQLDVSVERNVLTLQSERKPEERDTQKGGYHLRERFHGRFRRVLSLPEDVDPQRVEASYRNGVLAIKIAKQEAAKRRQVKVQAN